jgi:hypothetical protein
LAPRAGGVLFGPKAISFAKRKKLPLGGKKTEATEPLSPPPNNGDK